MFIIHQIFSLARDWSKRVTWANIPQLKLGIFPNFQNRARCEKDLKDNKHNSLHLGRKYVRIFVLGHYLFLVAHSFPRATLSENCSLLGTDNVRGQISWHIFAPNGGYCLFITIIVNIVRPILSQISARLKHLRIQRTWHGDLKTGFAIFSRGYVKSEKMPICHSLLCKQIDMFTSKID